MRLIILLIFLALMAALALFVWQWFKARADLQALRDNPPVRTALLVKLPREAEKSNVKMTRFFSRLERLMAHDKDSVANNENVISAALVGSGKPEGQAAQVRFILWSPPELTERVMLELQECYEGQAQITELTPESDPIGQWTSDQIVLKALAAQQQES